MRVYCLMGDGSNATTYMDVSGFTRFGGHDHNQRFQYRNFTKARMEYTKCLIRMALQEPVFSTSDTQLLSSGLASKKTFLLNFLVT